MICVTVLSLLAGKKRAICPCRKIVSVNWNTLLRALIAAAICVSVFASVAYAITWVELRAGVTSISSGTRAK